MSQRMFCSGSLIFTRKSRAESGRLSIRIILKVHIESYKDKSPKKPWDSIDDNDNIEMRHCNQWLMTVNKFSALQKFAVQISRDIKVSVCDMRYLGL
jgi:hypothetical protein